MQGEREDAINASFRSGKVDDDVDGNKFKIETLGGDASLLHLAS